MRVELRTEAREDLAEGAAFYDRQRPGLGDYFIESIFADLEALESLWPRAGISTSRLWGSSEACLSLPISRSTTLSLAH